MTYNITSYGTLKGGTSSLIFRHGPQGSLSRLKVAASCIDGHVAAFDFEEDMNTGARWSAKD
jgi:hypothetical protein